MNGYKRFMTAVKRQVPDVVPIWELIIDRPVIEALYGNISLLDFVEKEDLDGFTIFEDSKKELINDRTYKDEWGIIWKLEQNDIFYPFDDPIKNFNDLKKFLLPNADNDYLYESLQRAVKRFKGDKAIVFISNESFEYSHYLLGGMDKLFIYYYTEPDFVQELSEKIWEYQSKAIKNALEIGADVIAVGDDYAGRIGPLMSPEQFRRFILPYLQKAVNLVHKHGSYIIKHTDGKIWKILDDIIETGIDVIDPLEPIANMDIGKVKEKYGDRVCIAGNIDCTMVLTNGTVQEVVEAVKETIAKVAPRGGYILASSNSIHPGVNPDNYKVMIKAARKYGRYPIDKKMIEEYKDKSYIKKYLD